MGTEPKKVEPAEARSARGVQKALARARARAIALHTSGGGGLQVCRLLSRAHDALLGAVAGALLQELDLGPVAVMAVAGYGREELTPHTDLDLLLVRAPQAEPSAAEAFAVRLAAVVREAGGIIDPWGGSSRRPLTEEECLAEAQVNQRFRTALLDARPVAGDLALGRAISGRLVVHLEQHAAAEMVEDKVAEVRERRARFGPLPYLLEPHLKEGTGGLRDIEAARWIRRLARLPNPKAPAAYDHLLRLRNELHRAVGRKEDLLTFELQPQLAQGMGLGRTGRSVGQLMRGYYLAAERLQALADEAVSRAQPPKATAARPARRDSTWALGRLEAATAQALASPATQEPPRTLVHATGELLPREPDVDGLAEQILRSICWEEREQIRRASGPWKGRPLQALLIEPAWIALDELGIWEKIFTGLTRRLRAHRREPYQHYTLGAHGLFAAQRLCVLRAGRGAPTEGELMEWMKGVSDPLPLVLAAAAGGDDRAARKAGIRIGLGTQQKARLDAILRLTHEFRALLDDGPPAQDTLVHWAQRFREPALVDELCLLAYANIRTSSRALWELVGPGLAQLRERLKSQ